MDNQIEAIIFDLGGVLIELKENPFPDSWLSDSKSFLPSNWLSNDLASSFDRGEISAKEFGEDLKSSLGIDVALDEFLKEFAAWPVGPMPGVKSLLRDLRQNCTLVALSNNNEIHWPRVLNEFGGLLNILITCSLPIYSGWRNRTREYFNMFWMN